MSCVSIDPDPSEVSGDHSGLCSVCQRLDLPRLTGSQCDRDHDEGHFHLGPLHNILAKQFCPCCRLIATLMCNLNLSYENPETINVTLQLRLFHALGGGPGEKKPSVVITTSGSLIEVFIDHDVPFRPVVLLYFCTCHMCILASALALNKISRITRGNESCWGILRGHIIYSKPLRQGPVGEGLSGPCRLANFQA